MNTEGILPLGGCNLQFTSRGHQIPVNLPHVTLNSICGVFFSADVLSCSCRKSTGDTNVSCLLQSQRSALSRCVLCYSSEQQQRPHSAGLSVNMKFTWSESRKDSRPAVIISLRKLLPSCITSLSVRRKDSQGCTADVKDTPPSPEEKPDDLIGPDIDLLGDHYDLLAKGSRLSTESFDSGVSFKSDRSKDRLVHFKEGVSPSWLDLSSFQKKHDVSDDGFFESVDDHMAMRRTSSEPVKRGFHIPLRQQSPFMRAMRSIESIDSGLSYKSDQSKKDVTNFNDRVSVITSDFSSSEEEHDVADNEHLVKSPDDQGRETNQEVE